MGFSVGDCMLNKRNLCILSVLFLFTLLAGCSSNNIKDSSNDDSILGDLDNSSSTKHTDIPEADPLIKGVSYSSHRPFPQYSYQTRHNHSGDAWGYMFQGFRLGNHMGNPRVRRVAYEYTQKSNILSLMTRRSVPYLYMITNEVKRRGMPAEVALLPFIESGFKPKAYSRSGAAGLWQFMPSTGRLYGLPQNRYFDARLDPFAATQAALNYLQKLNRQFHGDWLLTFAAYNAGEGTVSRAITRFKRRHPGQRATFWNIELPAETQRYVPKLLAFKDVVLRPERYGIRLPYIPNQPQLVQVHVNKPVNLRLAATQAGLSQYALVDLNPNFLRGVTSPRQSRHVVVPRSHVAQVSDAIRRLPPAYASRQAPRGVKYSVRKGVNLPKVAEFNRASWINQSTQQQHEAS